MKKLTLSGLAGLQTEFPQLSDFEKKALLGGDNGTLHISGGTLYADLGGTTYIGNDGSVCYFAGVSFSNEWVMYDKAYQLNGIIHISQAWADDDFAVQDFAHEYGHYMQQEEMGNANYYADVVGPSSISEWLDPENHSSQWYEVDASQQGSAYYNQNVTYQ